ncbi:Acyl carrier protein [hydrothermal vent metagenome]|uniref:Acyl carrier protein n=1 Tax=hydrothermal vent metagenome TaxID=652676 RepID=A0A3B1CMJ2_9ZZZZ
MTGDGIKKALLEIMAEIVQDDNMTEVDPDKPLREQLDIDSMDFLDIVMELRKRYSIEVPEKDYIELATLNSSVSYLLPKVAAL